MARHLNLKYHSPMIAFVLVFGGIVYLSFKHTPEATLPPKEVGTTTVSPDQILLGAAAPAHRTLLLNITPTAVDVKKLETLNQIIANRNDNDPRMDSELKQLSPTAKRLFRDRYQGLKDEQRNARSTVVFVMGREIQDLNDVEFMHEVLTESPCHSLENCKSIAGSGRNERESHFEGLDETTLALPQIHALKGLQRVAQDSTQAHDLVIRARAEIQAAKQSSVPKVAKMAEEIEKSWIAQ